ncbi:MAG: hypothetical protein LIO41_03825 [Ruminococcus sp.]|nr:hypothetical protein [Ruminococcus sp.]
MKKELETQLKNLLKNIPDTYDDFERCVLRFCKDDEIGEKMIDYISSTDDVTTSDVLKFRYKLKTAMQKY